MNTDNLYAQYAGYLSIIFNGIYTKESFLGAEDFISDTFLPHDNLTSVRKDVYYYFIKDIMNNLVDGLDMDMIHSGAKMSIETLSIAPPQHYDSTLVDYIWCCMRAYFREFSGDDFLTAAYIHLPELYKPEDQSELKIWFDALNPPEFCGYIKEKPQSDSDDRSFEELKAEWLLALEQEEAEEEKNASLDDNRDEDKVVEESVSNIDPIYIQWIGYVSIILNTWCNKSEQHALDALNTDQPLHEDLDMITKDVHWIFFKELIEVAMKREPREAVQEIAQQAMLKLEQTQPEHYNRSIIRCIWNFIDYFLYDCNARVSTNYARITIPFEHRPLDNGDLYWWLDEINPPRLNARIGLLDDNDEEFDLEWLD